MNTVISLDHNDMQKLLAGEEVEIQMSQALVESNHVFIKPAPDALVGVEKTFASSFATFKDGHTEEIFYFKKHADDTVLFATRSGTYIHSVFHDTPCVLGVRPSTLFFKVDLARTNSIPDTDIEEDYTIESITLDERVRVRFTIDGKEGAVLVAPDATDEQIKAAIVDEILDYPYEIMKED